MWLSVTDCFSTPLGFKLCESKVSLIFDFILATEIRVQNIPNFVPKSLVRKK